MTNTKYSVARDHNKHFVTLEGDKAPIGYVTYAFGHGWQAIDANNKVVNEKIKGKDYVITHLIKSHEAKNPKTWKASEPAITERPKANAAPAADFTPEEMYGSKMSPAPSAASPKAEQQPKATTQVIVDLPNNRLSRSEWTATVTRPNGAAVQYKHHRLSHLIEAVREAEGNVSIMLPDGTPFNF